MFKYTVLLALAAASLITAQELDLIFNSEMIDVKPNMTINLDCGTRKDYRYCVWEHNNEVFQVEDIYDGVYEGKGKPSVTDDNQCGIVLENAHNKDHGTWTCTIFVRGSSLVGSKNISIMMKPTEPKVSADVIEATTTEEVEVQCSVMDARPAADILWFVGDWEITTDAESEVSFSETKGSYNTVSTLTHMFKPEEHGHKLFCKVDHPTLQEPMNTSLDVSVTFAPVEKPIETFYDVKEGSDYEVVLSFTANPAPTKVMWKYGDKMSEMMSVEVPSDNGKVMASFSGEDGLYRAVITINNITESDFEMDYLLHVENEIGMTEYQIRLSPKNETKPLPMGPDEKAEQSNGGMIAGIIIVILAVVLTLSAVVYTRHRQMLCFAVRTESKAHIKGSQLGGLEKGETNEGIKESTDNIDIKSDKEAEVEKGQIEETTVEEKNEKNNEKN